MRGRLVIVALCAVAIGSIAASVGASTRQALPAATCSLPGTVTCTTDSECVSFDATCDQQTNVCVCVTTDLGTDLGSDLGDDLGSDGGGGAGGGSGVGGFLGGGGQTGPPKSGGSGCSYAPGGR
jgi:hypothetical protein